MKTFIYWLKRCIKSQNEKDGRWNNFEHPNQRHQFSQQSHFLSQFQAQTQAQTQTEIKFEDKRGEKEKSWNKQNKNYCNLITIEHSFDRGILTISGNGNMTDYSGPNSTRWDVPATLIRIVIIQDPITSVGSFSFEHYYTMIESLEIANSVLKINQFAFRHCESLTSLNLPNSLTEIGQGVFMECYALASLNLSNSLTQIGKKAFSACTSLTSLILPNNLSIISVYCFIACSRLTSLIVPVGVTTLQEGAFYRCDHLESVNISHTVTNIGDYVFQYCSELTCVYYDGTTDPGSNASDVFASTKVDKVQVSTNYGSGNTFCGKPTEIGASCIINKTNSKTFSPTIKSKLSLSLIKKMRKHCLLFLFQTVVNYENKE